MLLRALLFVFVLLGPCYLVSQNIGLHPPHINWKSINTDSLRIIFPTEYAATAQRIAKLAHQLQANHHRSIGDQYYKFDLVLQTENITPNAYVGLAPFRSEFYTTPPQSFNQLGLTDWNDLLTIHEFRHVQQNSNERRGATRILSWLQGQYGWAVASGIATPNWFSEGDAVVMESALTSSGRGRLPAFTATLRAMEQAGVRYSYAKTRNGSYKDLVPSHYPYGYLYNVYARRKFGNDIWAQVLADGAGYKSIFYPFSSALKKHTGLSTPQLYQATMDDFWANEVAITNSNEASKTTTNLPPLNRLSIPLREPVNYRFSHPQADGSFVALRSSFRRTPEIVRVFANHKVEVLAQVGFQREPFLDVNGQLAVWNETRQNPRYTNESFSDIIVCNLTTGAKRRITHRGRYLSPSLSPDRKRIVAATYHPSHGAGLAIMNTSPNPTIDTLLKGQEGLFAWPVFGAEGKTIYALHQLNSRLAIVAINTADDGSARLQTLTPYEKTLMDNLTAAADGWLYFTSPLNGIDNIYRFHPKIKAFEQCTQVPIGAYQPGVGPAGRLTFSCPSPDGLYIANQPLAIPIPIHLYSKADEATDSAYAAEGGDILDAPLPQKDFPVENFSNYLGGIKLHSWSYNGSTVSPGLALEATNALNTIALEAEANYNINEARTGGRFSIQYGGLLPVIALEGRFRERSVLLQRPGFVDSLSINRQTFNQFEGRISASLPLSWLSGNYFIRLQPRLSFSRLQLSNQTIDDERLADGFNSIGGSLQFSMLHRQAVQQVQARWGIVIRLFADRLANGQQSGSRLLLRSNAFIPGISRTDGIRIDLDIQEESLNNAYQFPDGIQYARGFYAPFNDGAYRLGFNYQMPLVYPDFGIAGITYFKRIRLNAFYDIGSFRIDLLNRRFDMRSAGFEIFFDNSWLNTQDFTLGVQAARRLTTDFFAPANEGEWRFNFLFSGSF